MTINTTNGPKHVDPTRNPAHVVNTSRVMEEDLVYTDDEPGEILDVLPGTGWVAVVGGQRLPLVAWVAEDSGRLYGVAVGEDGLVGLVENNVEKLAGFQKYEQVNTTDKENNHG